MQLFVARVVAATLVGIALPAGSSAEGFGSGPPEVVVPVRAVGCYWEWGRMYCSRYCYVEINGRQYCHSRLRHARPQALPAHVRVRQKIMTRP